MISNNLTLETLRDNPYPTNFQHYNEIVNLIPIKEEDLQKQHTETFDKTNHNSVRYQFQEILSEYQNEEDVEKLTLALKKLYKLVYDIPSYITFSNFSLDTKQDLIGILIRTKTLIKIFEQKVLKKKEYKQSDQVELLQRWQWNEELAREILAETEHIANEALQKYDFVRAEESSTDSLMLVSQIAQNNQSFDPNLQNLEKKIRNNLQMSQSNKMLTVKQQNGSSTKLETDKLRKISEEIDKHSTLYVPLFKKEDTHLSKMMDLSFEKQTTFRDTEFCQVNNILYSNTKLYRLPLSKMAKIDPLSLKPSKLTKQLKKQSALLACLTSIIYKNKEAIRDMFYPRMPISKTPLYNPNGKYIIRLYLNGNFRQLTIDDYLIQNNNGQDNTTFFYNDLDFFYALIHKAFQKLKNLGLKVEEDPSIYNWILMGPNWIPEKVLFSPMASKFHYCWELIKKATNSGILIARKKISKKESYSKRVYYNVHTIIDLGSYRLLVMQNVSKVDGLSIPEELKLQVEDVGGNQQVYTRILAQLQDEITDHNGMFITSYQRFLENFDYGYINWRADTPLLNNSSTSQAGPQAVLFNNSFVLHRKDIFAVSNDYKVTSFSKNPQFKLKISEQYQDTVVWILIQNHTLENDHQKQLSFDIYPKRYSRATILTSNNSVIQKNYKKTFGQDFILGKVHLNQQTDGNEISLILTCHNYCISPSDPHVEKDLFEEAGYSLYFYSVHKLQIEELKNELNFSQAISYETIKDLSSNPNEYGFTNCPQFSIQPKIESANQKFHFQIYVTSKEEHPLSFNIYDSSFLPNYQLIYGKSPLYTSTHESSKFAFLEGDFIINPPDLTKFNVQVVPTHDKVPKQVPFEIKLYSNIKCDFARIPYDQERFERYEFMGVWNNMNAGGTGEHYKANPKYLLQLPGNSWLRIQIIVVGNPQLMANASMFHSPFQINENPNFDIFSTSKLALSTTREDFSVSGPKKMLHVNEPWKQISEFTQITGGNYIMIPSLSTQGAFGKYCVRIYSSSKINFREFDVYKE